MMIVYEMYFQDENKNDFDVYSQTFNDCPKRIVKRDLFIVSDTIMQPLPNRYYVLRYFMFNGYFYRLLGKYLGTQVDNIDEPRKAYNRFDVSSLIVLHNGNDNPIIENGKVY